MDDKKEKQHTIYTVLTLICAIWFLLTGWIWIYYACLAIAYPFGLIGFWLWRKGDQKNLWNMTAGLILAAGLALSLSSLLVLTVFN
jgi:hypothetical protein